MGQLNAWNIVAGLVAYAVAVFVGAGPLVFLGFWFNVRATKRTDEEQLLKTGHRSTAIELGATVLCQSILARHAVFAMMAVARACFVEDLAGPEIFWLVLRMFLVCLILAVLSWLSVRFSVRLFKWLTRNLKEDEEVLKDNVAMAIFLAFILLAITMILNEGMEDLSRSLIPYGRSGLIQFP